MTRVVTDDLTDRLTRLSNALEHDTLSLCNAEANYGHNIRLAIRRARAAIKASVPRLGIAMVHGLIDDLRWLTRLIGTVRDLDCAAQALRQDCPVEDWELIHPYLEAERLTAIAVVCDALRSERMQALRQRVAVAIQLSIDNASVPQKDAVARRAKRLLARFLTHTTVGGTSNRPEQLHELRKLIKNFRYTLEMLPEVEAEPWVHDIADELHRLQDWLGEIQDLSVLCSALEHVRQCFVEPGSELEQRLAAQMRCAADARDGLIRLVPSALCPLLQMIRRSQAGERLAALAER